MSSADGAITISPNHLLFDLPDLVAIEEGLFARAGLAVRFATDADGSSPTERNPNLRHKEALFRTARADAYNLCEWGGIDRLERAGGGRLGHLRAAVVAQGLVSLDPELNEPHDLGGVPVGVNEFTGSHYTALHLLGSAVPRTQIRLTHVGSPKVRLRRLIEGSLRATMLMEPFLSLALQRGAHLLASYTYRGTQVLAAHLSPEHQDGYVSAVNKAVDLINADPTRYAPRIVAELDGQLAPEDLLTQYYRYTHVVPLRRKRFTETYAWMRSWQLTDGRSGYESLLALP
jgi:hypothetical protein